MSNTITKKTEILEVFDNPKPDREYVITHYITEFTSLCPKTGQPDFAKFRLEYIADKLCVELKSLKLYFQSYRNDGIYFEDVTNKILDDLVEVIDPLEMRLTAKFNMRGGIYSIIEASHLKIQDNID